MKIIIAGAGDVGYHLAELLSKENQDIFLIDKNEDVLNTAANRLDIKTFEGDSTSITILENAGAQEADLLLAVTTSEKINILTAILAKQLGTKTTIARVSNQEYISEKQKKAFAGLGVDTLISTQELASKEILRLLQQGSFTDIFEFEGGLLNLVGFSLDEFSPLVNINIGDIPELKGKNCYKPIAILRGNTTIIPKPHTTLRRNDHLYFISKKEEVEKLVEIFGKKQVRVKQVMILGGTELAYNTAKMLLGKYRVSLVEADKEKAKQLSDKHDDLLVLNFSPSRTDLLESEGLNNMDAFIALTPNSEINIITSLTAKNHGVYKTIAQVDNKEYTHISQNIGVDTLINKKLIAANNIFRFVRKGRIEAITSLHGVDAEVIEFSVGERSELLNGSLNCHEFPEKALIGGVIRGTESLIPNGEFQLQVNDKVIIFAMPDAIPKVEKLFER